MSDIHLGDEVRDIVTGFEGMATGRAEYLFSAAEIQVQPRQLDDRGLPIDPVWVRESRLTAKKKYVCNEAMTEQFREEWERGNDEASKNQG